MRPGAGSTQSKPSTSARARVLAKSVDSSVPRDSITGAITGAAAFPQGFVRRSSKLAIASSLLLRIGEGINQIAGLKLRWINHRHLGRIGELIQRLAGDVL